MEAHHYDHQKMKENNVEKEISEGTELKQEKEEEHAVKYPASSSPSHEFSFTTILGNSKASLPSHALDLSPADDIFFHGHLLPLHLLSHLPSPPRFSTNSFHSLLEDEHHSNKDNGCNSNSSSNNNNIAEESLSKSKSTFSLFGLVKGHKGCQVRDNKEDKEKQKKKLGFEVIHALKRYLQIVQPLVLFRGRREKVGLQKECYSHSGNLMRRNKHELMGRRRGGGYSAPASMRTSQTNTTLLLATTTTTLPPHNDSSMEELQSAIQAAIAHCKNSIAAENKC